MLEKIKIWCRVYVVNLAIYAVLFAIGGLVKDAAAMRGAAAVSAFFVGVMCIVNTLRRKDISDDDDSKHEEKLQKYNEDHADLIKSRCIKLREEVKNRYADMGVKWKGNDFQKDTFFEIIELEAMLLFNPEIDQTNNFSTTLNLNAADVVVFSYPLPAAKYAMGICKMKQMTEEEVMQRKMLKEMGIQQ